VVTSVLPARAIRTCSRTTGRSTPKPPSTDSSGRAGVNPGINRGYRPEMLREIQAQGMHRRLRSVGLPFRPLPG
jgi:hypothetical protein